MKAYMEARKLTQEFIDDFLGYWIDPRNSKMTSLLVGCGLPGGMMGSLMADLKGLHAAINANLKKRGEKELSEDELLVELFQEVQRVWPMLGTPCLVTPFSQYVKNAALMNIFSRSMGEKPFSRMDPAMWGMILGKSGKLPGTLAPEIIELAKEKNLEFYTDDPQKLYPDVLPQYIKEMKELGWDRGQDDEELFEFAMHDKQYREYKSGQAKEQFNKDLAERMQKAGKPVPEELQKYLATPASQASQIAQPAQNNDFAAVAYALFLAGKKPKEGIITLPEIHNTAWNHKFYTLK
jgi:pyruvate carboxylase subunit B